jgi:hypothetical protein
MVNALLITIGVIKVKVPSTPFANEIVCGAPASLLALATAVRKLPAPLSARFETTYAVACASDAPLDSATSRNDVVRFMVTPGQGSFSRKNAGGHPS